MRGSLKVGKLQYYIVSKGTKAYAQKMATKYRGYGYLTRVKKLTGIATGEYGLYVLPKKVKR